MSAEERLENLFQEGVALLDKGESPARAAQTLNMNGDTDEIVPLLQIVDTAYELKRYRMPASTKAALLAKLTEQIEEKDRKPLIFIPPTDTAVDEPIRFTPRRDPQQRWNLFLRVQQAVVAAALVVALAFIILQSTGQNNTSLTTPTPAVTSTAIPSPVVTLTPAPPVTPTPQPTHQYYEKTEMPAPTTDNTRNEITVAPNNTEAPVPTGTPAPSPAAFVTPTAEPTTRNAVTTQANQPASNNTQAAVQTVPPAAPTATPRVVAPTAKPAVPPTAIPTTEAARPNPTATPVPPTTAPPAPTNTQVNTAVPVPTNTQVPVPTNTPQQVVVTTQAPNTTAPSTTVDDHGGGGGSGGGGNSGSGSTKTPSPTPAPTPTKKPSGKG